MHIRKSLIIFLAIVLFLIIFTLFIGDFIWTNKDECQQGCGFVASCQYVGLRIPSIDIRLVLLSRCSMF